MLISKKSKPLFLSFSVGKFMLGCLDDKYFSCLSAWLGESQSHHIISKLHIKMLVLKDGPNVDPIGTPSTCV